MTATGSGHLRALDFLGGNVELVDVTAGSPVIVRTNYYPAWRAYAGERELGCTRAMGSWPSALPKAALTSFGWSTRGTGGCRFSP